jgi:hypothetical protein
MIARLSGRTILPTCLLLIWPLLLCLALSACGDLPQPFLHNPGATAQRLAQPPAPLLAVPPGTDTLLTDAGNKALADQLAQALQTIEVPAIVKTPDKADWHLVTKATDSGTMVQPEFTVIDPTGKVQGSAHGEPVPVADWASASPAILHQVASGAAPRISAMLTSIRIAREKADPNSLYNRTARVEVPDVTGAPGDGNQTLTAQMRARLAVLGPEVLTTPTDADFIVQGQVVMVPEAGHKERVEIQWIIKTGSGDERGRVVQLNEIPAGSLDHYWGDVAVVVASEASNGVNDVIKRQSDKEPTPGAAAPAAAANPQVPGQTPGPTPAGTPSGAKIVEASPSAEQSPPVVTLPGPKPEPATPHLSARRHGPVRHAQTKAGPTRRTETGARSGKPAKVKKPVPTQTQ